MIPLTHELACAGEEGNGAVVLGCFWAPIALFSVIVFIQEIHSLHYLPVVKTCGYSLYDETLLVARHTRGRAFSNLPFLPCCWKVPSFLWWCVEWRHTQFLHSNWLFKVHVGTSVGVVRGCTEKTDTVRYADTVRYKTYSRGRLNALASTVSPLYYMENRTR